MMFLGLGWWQFPAAFRGAANRHLHAGEPLCVFLALNGDPVLSDTLELADDGLDVHQGVLGPRDKGRDRVTLDLRPVSAALKDRVSTASTWGEEGIELCRGGAQRDP